MILGFKKTLILVSGILRDSEGKLLLLQRSQHSKTYKGYWQLPEGKIHFSENPEKALKREIKEETNLRVVGSKLISVHNGIIHPFGISFHLIRLVYQVDWKGKLKISSEHCNYSWYSIKDIKTVFPKTKSVVEILKKIF